MYSLKKLFEISKTLNILYVEDDEGLREDMYALLSPLFKHIDLAEDGVSGLERYNGQHYDLVITDINMPRMNGIEMIYEIRLINPEQKIISVTAHSEGDILINIIKAGVNSFILKPIFQDEVVNTLYPICRDAYVQNMNIDLLNQLHEEKSVLEQQNKELKAQANTIETKHKQLGNLLQSEEDTPLAKEYFQKDEDEGYENIVILSDHCDDLLEIFNEIPEIIGAMQSIQDDDINLISVYIRKAATIFMYYTPYVDIISDSLNSLSSTISENHEQFKELLVFNPQSLLMLFDAVSSDMERYTKRFSVESLAMKNAHHIHRPTALSIQQIIDLISPTEAEYGEMELF